MKLDHGYLSQSFLAAPKPIDGHEYKLEDVVAKLAPAGHILSTKNWLPAAAEHYKISTDLRDYLIIPLPAFISDLPNTNGEAATLQELMAFDPETGRMAYESFQRMPTFADHDNQDISKAKGVIFDSFIKNIKGFGGGRFYKSVQLLGFDRTKDAALANEISSRVRNTYSVGYSYSSYRCSICGRVVSKGVTPCAHTRLGMRTYVDNSGRLVYRQNCNIRGFENSSVVTPAYAIAVGPVVMDASNAKLI